MRKNRTSIGRVLLVVVILTSDLSSAMAATVPVDSAKLDGWVGDLHKGPASRELLFNIVDAGLPGLDAVLNDLSKDDLIRRTGAKSGSGQGLGELMAKDAYFNNVVRVVEFFGLLGVDRLVSRLPVSVVKQFELNSPQFKAMGTGTVRPLLTMETLGKVTNEEAESWASQWVDTRRVNEVFRLAKDENALAAFAGAVAAGVVANAVYEGAKYAYKKYAGENQIILSNRKDKLLPMLSAEARARVLLAELNPDTIAPQSANHVVFQQAIFTVGASAAGSEVSLRAQ